MFGRKSAKLTVTPDKKKPSKSSGSIVPEKKKVSGDMSVTADRKNGKRPERRGLFGRNKVELTGNTNENMAKFIKECEAEIEIYVHIPFCVRKCQYCDFLSAPSTSKGSEQKYVESLCKEIILVAEQNRDEKKKELNKDYTRPVRSIYFGGGTPTVLKPQQLAEVLKTIRDHFQVKEDAEITFECNPGTVDENQLWILRQAGFNRISIGMQSADTRELALLGRIHTHEQTKECVALARKAGFTNLNLDIMSALPGQSELTYERTLREALALKPEHISAYSLIVEPGTPFYEKYSEGAPLEGELPGEDTDRRMYARTKELFATEGYTRYEISNYAKPGFECIHNLGYWTGYDYLGFGLGASSLWDRTRYNNANRLEEYNQAVALGDLGQLHKNVEKLTQKACMEEHMFLGLRTCKGISKSDFEQKFGVKYETILGPATAKLSRQGLIATAEDGDRIYLTDLGLDVSNRVFAEFILDD